MENTLFDIPEIFDDEPLFPLLDLSASVTSAFLSTWIVCGLCLGVITPELALLLGLILGTGRALTGSGIRIPYNKT